ncbi:hypothetical protein FOA52_007375 [Chlamydomonas sp. UWO 241]|nr:hypothetical protein FOA52_007375 [Chlamydomonas sp. UWO 241]
MRVVSAYLLAVLGGNAAPAEADIKAILASVGVEAESASIQKLIGELAGKDVADVIAEGKKSLAAMPSGGGAVSAGAAAPAAAAGAAAPAAKKEEKPESDEDMGFSLFD